MDEQLPGWLPEWLRDALAKPTMSVPDAGRALFDASRGQAYIMAHRGDLPVVRGGRRMQVPTRWVRQQLMLDER